MATYTIFEHPQTKDRQAVKNGLFWWPFFLHSLGVIIPKRSRTLGIIWFITDLVAYFAIEAVVNDPATTLADVTGVWMFFATIHGMIQLGLWLGFNAYYRRRLINRGYLPIGAVPAKSDAEAVGLFNQMNESKKQTVQVVHVGDVAKPAVETNVEAA